MQYVNDSDFEEHIRAFLASDYPPHEIERFPFGKGDTVLLKWYYNPEDRPTSEAPGL